MDTQPSVPTKWTSSVLVGTNVGAAAAARGACLLAYIATPVPAAPNTPARRKLRRDKSGETLLVVSSVTIDSSNVPVRSAISTSGLPGGLKVPSCRTASGGSSSPIWGKPDGGGRVALRGGRPGSAWRGLRSVDLCPSRGQEARVARRGSLDRDVVPRGCRQGSSSSN